MADPITRRRFFRIAGTAAGTVLVGGGALRSATWAPEPALSSKRMGEGEMKALVIYGTKSGCTQGIAEQIGTTLAGQGCEVDVFPAEKAPGAGGYDAVVVGSGVRAGQWHQAARAWVEENAEALTETPHALYTVGLMITEPGKEDEVRAYTDPLIEAAGIEPIDVGLFAGWFEPKRFSFVERSILNLMKSPEGDRRDMDAIAEWTRTTATKMRLS